MHDLRYLDIFTDAFGAENLKVVALESLVKKGASLVTQFATMIGFSDALANALLEKRINASLTLEGAFLASELNKFAGQSVGRRKRPDGTIAETRGLPARPSAISDKPNLRCRPRLSVEVVPHSPSSVPIWQSVLALTTRYRQWTPQNRSDPIGVARLWHR